MSEKLEHVPYIVPGMPDAELAAQVRRRVADKLSELVPILQAASDEGLIVNFNVGPNQYGRIAVIAINIVKPL